jgi:hypothetical protein
MRPSYRLGREIVVLWRNRARSQAYAGPQPFTASFLRTRDAPSPPYPVLPPVSRATHPGVPSDECLARKNREGTRNLAFTSLASFALLMYSIPLLGTGCLRRGCAVPFLPARSVYTNGPPRVSFWL